jgi:ribonuclease E
MIQSDGSLTGQQSFVIERGGIARPKPVTAAPRISPDSVSVEVGHEEEEPAEEMDNPLLGSNVEEVSEPHHEDRNGGDGARRGSRRRRGRRGRGGSGGGQPREPMPAQNFSADTAEPFSEGGESEFAPQGEQSSQGGEARGPDGEPRKRRRRGRRGGRRNRHERNGRGPAAEGGTDQNGVETQNTGHDSGNDFGHESAPAHGSPSSFEAAPAERAPATFEPAQEPAPANDSAPKRRSTVREPAPFVNFDQNGDSGASASHTPARAESSSETKGGGEIESDRPRRSGWWSKLRGE